MPTYYLITANSDYNLNTVEVSFDDEKQAHAFWQVLKSLPALEDKPFFETMTFEIVPADPVTIEQIAA